ncbi:DUF6488 family protein [Spartinivicinus poritis]|uniref:DUF6488 family protein n=1 Tax=Spartinivicinus poritis TaxID=2994640 RepID=A0ABT5U3T6_9GAMM|nr:DUF6488 family protein [Spartinivicinus sp. A2-2]MDE1460875.1 DUF6488 family protein [Spartinivicinus sp. A2-2]
MFIVRLMSVALLSVVLAGPVNAHSNHGVAAPISETQVSERAEAVKQQLISSKQVAESWKNVKNGSISQQDAQGGKLWVVKYDNPQATDPANKSLYVFIDELGNIITANYTGKL